MKKIKKLLAILLSLSLAIACSIVPFSAHASDTYSVSFGQCFFEEQNSYDSDEIDINSLPWSGTSPNILQCNLQTIEILLNFDNPAVHKGEQVVITINTWQGGRYDHFGRVQLSSAPGLSMNSNDYTVSYNDGIYTITYTADFTSSDVTVDINFITPFYTSSWANSSSALTSHSYFKLTACTMYFSDTAVYHNKATEFFSKVGEWFSNLWEWLQNILNSITTFRTNVGTWFTNISSNISGFISGLGDRINTFFTNLWANLSTAFSNIGTWFSNLGDRIRDFFTSLGDRISTFFTNIWTNFTDWWNSLWNVSEGYFDTYKQNWQLWLESHLGFMYQSLQVIDEFYDDTTLFNKYSNSPQGAKDTKPSSFLIPGIKLPSLQNTNASGIVITSDKRINLNDYFRNHSTMNTMFDTFQLVLSGFTYLGLFFMGKRKLEKLLAGRAF